MALAFVTGLFANNPALHAALWLLMIGGPPSHGATVRKFVIRAIGAAAALGLAVLATALISPSATNLFPYMVAIFIGGAADGLHRRGRWVAVVPFDWWYCVRDRIQRHRTAQ